MDALENAGRLTANEYKDCVIFTTLSPCSMCSGAILLYNIPEVVIGENITFKGEEELLTSRGIKIKVLQNTKCIEIMKNFIENNPELWNEDIGV
jgi:cytosine/creatinine deaminase